MTTPDPYTSERRLCDDTGWVSDLPVEDGSTLTYLGQHNDLAVRTGRKPLLSPFLCSGGAHLAGEHIRCTSPAHTPEDECSPTPPLSSTEPDVGERPSPGPSARAETREVSYAVPVPMCEDGSEVEVTMRLFARRGRPEIWQVTVPPHRGGSSPDRLPMSVVVEGRERAEALCRALAVNYAIHTGEIRRSDQRYALHALHFLREAGVEE